MGVLITLTGCALTCVADSLLRWAHCDRRIEVNGKEDEKGRLHENSGISRMFAGVSVDIVLAAGIWFSFLDGALDWIALCFSTESLIASLGGASILINAIVAPWLVGEKLYPQDFIITGLIFFGTTLCLVYSDHSSNIVGVDELEQLLFNPRFLHYSALMLSFIVCLTLIFFNTHYYFLATLPISPDTVERIGKTMHLLAVPSLSAAFGGLSSMFSKASSSVVFDTIAGEQTYKYAGAYLISVLFFTFLVLEIYINNEALKHYDALVVVPIWDVMFGFIGILNGDMFFNDMQTSTTRQWVFFWLGCLMNATAILLILTRPNVTEDSPTGAIDEIFEPAPKIDPEDLKFLLVPIDEMEA